MADKKWFTPGTVVIDGETVPAVIPCPHTHTPVPAEGKWVNATDEFYVRRMLDGDGTLDKDAPPGVAA